MGRPRPLFEAICMTPCVGPANLESCGSKGRIIHADVHTISELDRPIVLAKDNTIACRLLQQNWCADKWKCW